MHERELEFLRERVAQLEARLERQSHQGRMTIAWLAMAALLVWALPGVGQSPNDLPKKGVSTRGNFKTEKDWLQSLEDRILALEVAQEDAFDVPNKKNDDDPLVEPGWRGKKKAPPEGQGLPPGKGGGQTEQPGGQRTVISTRYQAPFVVVDRNGRTLFEVTGSGRGALVRIHGNSGPVVNLGAGGDGMGSIALYDRAGKMNVRLGSGAEDGSPEISVTGKSGRMIMGKRGGEFARDGFWLQTLADVRVGGFTIGPDGGYLRVGNSQGKVGAGLSGPGAVFVMHEDKFAASLGLHNGGRGYVGVHGSDDTVLLGVMDANEKTGAGRINLMDPGGAKSVLLGFDGEVGAVCGNGRNGLRCLHAILPLAR